MLFTPLAEKWHSCNHNQHLDDATANNAPTLVRMPGQPATQQNTLQATHTCRASAVSWMTHVLPCCVQAARITALPHWKLFFLPHILQLCTSAGQQDAALFFSPHLAQCPALICITQVAGHLNHSAEVCASLPYPSRQAVHAAEAADPYAHSQPICSTAASARY